MDDVLRTALDALIIYLATLLMVRIGAKRFMGKNTAFDMIMGIMIGSVASRAINGSAEILPTIAGVLVLVLLHWLFAILAFHSDRFGTLIKGEARHLIKNGEKQADAIRGGHISQHDLLEAIRMQGNVETLEEVQSAWLERSGQISVIKSKTPKVVEVSVQEGVQTVRIEIG